MGQDLISEATTRTTAVDDGTSGRPAPDPGPHPVGTRFPMNIAEEIFAPDHPDQPPTMHFELRVAGRIDEARLADSIARACEAHAMTRVRLASRRFLIRPPIWEFADLELGGVVRSTSCADDDRMVEIRDAFYSRPVELDTAPAIRALLVHRPGGDSLLFNLHHSLMDGIGTLRWINSVARSYAGRPDPLPPGDPLALRDLSTMADAAGDRAPGEPGPTAPAGIISQVAGTAAGTEPGYGICNLALPPEICGRLDPGRYGPDTTLNDLLLAAVHLGIDAWNARRARACQLLSVLVPVNMRPLDCYNEFPVNRVIVARSVSTPEARADPATLLQTLTEQGRRMRSGAGFSRLLSRPAWVRTLIFQVILPLMLYWPRVVPRAIKGQVDSILFANMGRIERKVCAFGGDAGRLTEFWVSPPITMPMGIGLDSVILNGKLHLSLRYRRALFDRAAALEFLDLYANTLINLGRGDDRG